LPGSAPSPTVILGSLNFFCSPTFKTRHSINTTAHTLRFNRRKAKQNIPCVSCAVLARNGTLDPPVDRVPVAGEALCETCQRSVKPVKLLLENQTAIVIPDACKGASFSLSFFF